MEKYSRQTEKYMVYYYKSYKNCNRKELLRVKNLLLFLLGISAYFDWKEDRIPNGIWIFGSAAGLLFTCRILGIRGCLEALAWMALMYGLLFLFWKIGVIGGGDVKLVMMAACFLGRKVMFFLMDSAVCTAVLCAVLLFYRRNGRRRIEVFFSYLSNLIKSGCMDYPFDPMLLSDREEGGIHVSWGILAGYLAGRLWLKHF